MYLDMVDRCRNYTQSLTDMLRLVLYKGEVFRLPATFKEVRVLSGYAWLTVNGKDIMLGQGEQVSISAEQDFALVSAISNKPLVLEARTQLQPLTTPQCAG